jgi:hypothetical protein
LGTHLHLSGYSSDPKFTFNTNYESWFVTKLDLSLEENNCFTRISGSFIPVYQNVLINMETYWTKITTAFTEEHTEIGVLDKTSTFAPLKG